MSSESSIKKKIKKKTLTPRQMVGLMVVKNSGHVEDRLEQIKVIERKLYHLIQMPEIGSLIRALIRTIVGIAPVFNTEYQMFFTMEPNAMYTLLETIVTSIFTHGMIAVRTEVQNGMLRIINNWQDDDLYENEFSFFDNTLKTDYVIFTAPGCVPKRIKMNPFCGLCSDYLPQMLNTRTAMENMRAGNEGSTQRSTVLASDTDLFKIAKNLADDNEMDAEWEEHNTRMAISPESANVGEIEDPGMRKYRKTMDMIINTVYERFTSEWKGSSEIFDPDKGVVTTSYNVANTAKIPPGMKVTMSPPASTGVASYHLICERVRNEIASEFNLARDVSGLAEIVRFNAESVLCDIFNTLLNPAILGKLYLEALLEEYYVLRDETNEEDAIDDDTFPIINTFFEIPLSEIHKDDEHGNIGQILHHVEMIYHEMEAVVESQILSYNTRDQTKPVIQITWSPIDKKNTMDVKLSVNKESQKTVDASA